MKDKAVISKLKVVLFTVVMIMALSGLGFAQVNLDFGSGAAPTFTVTGPADTLTITAPGNTIHTTNVQVGLTTVTPPAVVSGAAGVPILVNFTTGDPTATFVSAAPTTSTTTTTNTGGVLSEPTGNLTLTRGSTQTDTATYDVATVITTCQLLAGCLCPGPANCGNTSTVIPGGIVPNTEIITTETAVTGILDAGAGTWTPGPVPPPVAGPVTITPGTGHLFVDGGGANVNAADPATGLTAAALTVSPTEASLTFTNPGTGIAHGLVVRSNETSLSGGTNSTNTYINDGGYHIYNGVSPAWGGTGYELYHFGNGPTIGQVNFGNNANGVAGSLTIYNGTGGNGIVLDGATGNGTFLGALSSASLTTSGSATIGGLLTANGGLTVNGLSTLNGAVNQTGGGQVTFSGNVDANNGLDVTGAFTVNGATTLAGTLDQTGGGQVTFSGNVDANNGLDVTGTLNANNALNVAGLTTTNGIANVSGNITNTGNLTNNGNATIGGNLAVTGTTTLTGNLTANGNTNSIGTAASTNTITGVTSIVNGTRSVVVNASSASMNAGSNNVTVSASGVGMNGNGATASLNGTSAYMSNSSNSYVDLSGSQATLHSSTGANVVLQGSNASLTNNIGHGIAVNSYQTVVSGGTTSTSLTLDDSGATFEGDADVHGNATVTGVANGHYKYDAVNYGQLKKLESKVDTLEDRSFNGLAAVTAMANLPQVDQNKKFSIAAAYGNFRSSSGFAVGGSLRVAKDAIIKGSVAFAGSETVFGIGAGYSW